MLHNNVYNLMNQLVEESKSLKRIKKDYAGEKHCKKCNEIWKKLKADKEEHVKELSELLKEHM